MIAQRGPVASGRTVSPYDQGVAGHPGAPFFFHMGLGARAGIVGSVGFSNGAPTALVLPPDVYDAVTYVRVNNLRDGLLRAGQKPTLGNAPAIGKGQ